MSINTLKILEWNVGKGREAQHSLLNDEETNQFDLLLLSEPYKFIPKNQENPIAPQHHYWETVIPTNFTRTSYDKNNFRSMIYVNKRIPFKQIPIPHADLTAVTIKRGETIYLVVSVYAYYHPNKSQRERELQNLLQEITQAWQQVQLQHQANSTQLIIAGDFNRHDITWGGARIANERIGEGEPILNFMIQHQLYSALPQGIITYTNKAETSCTTIDLFLIPMQLQASVYQCQKYNIDHGSDHKAMALTLRVEEYINTQPRKYRSYNMVDWDNIRMNLRLGPTPIITSKEDLDKGAQELEERVQEILQNSTPEAKPLPYAKRWWTLELTNLRRDYNQKRNQWTASKKRGEYDRRLQFDT